MSIKAPFKSSIPLSVSQEYGNTSNNEWYKANGILAPFHSGTDIYFGDFRQTFGTPCLCPFDNASVVNVWWSDPHTTKGNGVTIQSESIDGVIWQVVFWHTCEVKVKIGDKLKLGDIVCYVGNSGLCTPPRSILSPFAGSHCHLMLFKYVLTTKPNGSEYILQDEDNLVGGARNPRELFDFTQCQETGEDTGFSQDMWSISDFVKDMTPDILVKYFKYLGF